MHTKMPAYSMGLGAPTQTDHQRRICTNFDWLNFMNKKIFVNYENKTTTK